MATPPISASTNSNSWLCSLATISRARRASRSTSGPTPSPGSHAMRAFMYRNEILIFDSLLAVRDFQKFDVSFLELLTRQRVAKLAIARLQGVTSRMFPENDHAARHPDAVRRHDFVGHGVFQHAVLMDSRLVRECILTNDRFIHLDLFARQLAEHLARAIQLFGLYSRGDVVITLARVQCHDDFFQ